MAESLSRFRTRDLGWTQDKEGLSKFVRGRIWRYELAEPAIVQFAKDHVELRFYYG
jgi:hypothetical protein